MLTNLLFLWKAASVDHSLLLICLHLSLFQTLWPIRISLGVSFFLLVEVFLYPVSSSGGCSSSYNRKMASVTSSAFERLPREIHWCCHDVVTAPAATVNIYRYTRHVGDWQLEIIGRVVPALVVFQKMRIEHCSCPNQGLFNHTTSREISNLVRRSR